MTPTGLAQAVPARMPRTPRPPTADTSDSPARPLTTGSEGDKGEMGPFLLFLQIKLAFLFPLKLKCVVDHVLPNPDQSDPMPGTTTLSAPFHTGLPRRPHGEDGTVQGSDQRLPARRAEAAARAGEAEAGGAPRSRCPAPTALWAPPEANPRAGGHVSGQPPTFC